MQGKEAYKYTKNEDVYLYIALEVAEHLVPKEEVKAWILVLSSFPRHTQDTPHTRRRTFMVSRSSLRLSEYHSKVCSISSDVRCQGFPFDLQSFFVIIISQSALSGKYLCCSPTDVLTR